ncbi:UNVERIFIED_CONTAM: Cysteine synthase 2 [Sesamum angustifolium]|uniref:cysteine synthase n=1 Tax=Sesamum angustifolium TaxID=2727405 RepID=A0AAW2PEG4_9LAMI
MAPPARTAGAAVTALSVIAMLSYIILSNSRSSSKSSSRKARVKKSKSGLVAAIGNTPLIRINSLSDATGCEILGKAEFLNPGGSVKDRVAVKIIEEALESGALAPGGVVTEGSAGSTAISLATVAPAYGCRCHVVIPDDAAIEKEKTSSIKCFLIDPPGSGLFNKVTRGVMYTREEAEGRRLKNPFDTITEGIGINRLTENFKLAALDGLSEAPIWRLLKCLAWLLKLKLCSYRMTCSQGFMLSVYSGNCFRDLASVSKLLLMKGTTVRNELCPYLVLHLVIGYLLKSDGLFLGSSSAMNCVGAVKVAQKMGPGHTIVTILCDSGMRHLSKFYDAQYLSEHGLTPSASGLEFLGLGAVPAAGDNTSRASPLATGFTRHPLPLDGGNESEYLLDHNKKFVFHIARSKSKPWILQQQLQHSLLELLS